MESFELKAAKSSEDFSVTRDFKTLPDGKLAKADRIQKIAEQIIPKLQDDIVKQITMESNSTLSANVRLSYNDTNVATYVLNFLKKWAALYNYKLSYDK